MKGGIGQVSEKVFPQAGGVDAAVVLKSISKAEHTGIQRGDAGAVRQQVVQLDGRPGGKGSAGVGPLSLSESCPVLPVATRRRR